MRKGFLFFLGYLISMGAGLAPPALVIMQRSPLGWDDLLLYILSGALMVVATIMACLLAAKIAFPEYWWRGQVEGKDVFEFEGIYFMGLRITRVPTRLQRLLFGVDERMRRWDMIFGLLFMAMVVPHIQAMITANRYLDENIPNPPRISQTLHQNILSNLPLMQEWKEGWTLNEEFTRRVGRELQLLKMQPRRTNDQRFKLAQLYLLSAFTQRDRASEPFYHSPGEQVFFNRSQGAQAVSYLNQLLDQPDAERAGWSGGAHAMIGFFHLSEENYPKALEHLQQAMKEIGEGDETQIARYQIFLMAAQGATLAGMGEEAMKQLEIVLVNESLPKVAYALAMEQFAEALRQTGDLGQIPELLTKAEDLYTAEKDVAGLARIHLHRAALALDMGDAKKASRELSSAASLAHKLGDGFTLNMVERLSQAFSG